MTISKKELLNEFYGIGKSKANLNFKKISLLAIFAGLFISFAAFSFVVVNTGMQSLNKTYAKFISAICFSFGLFAVVVSGAELFTGNILMLQALLKREISLKKVFRNWTLVYIFNFLGCILTAVLIYFSGLLNSDMQKFLHNICIAKTTAPFLELIFRGIGCNIFVCLGVWMAFACKDRISKFFSCMICIILFIICGFEHSVANMFYLFLSFMKNDITFISIFYDLIPVTIGNILGGAVVAVGYYFIYED